MTIIDRPTLYCPLDLIPHPAWQQAQAEAFAWMDRCRLFEKTDISRVASLGTNSAQVTGSMIPHASPDQLRFYVTYMYWGFIVDDVFDVGVPAERAQRYQTLCRPLMLALESPWALIPDGEPPVVTLLRELRRNADELFSPAQVRLWVDSLYTWLLGCGLEITDAAHERSLSVSDYLFASIYSHALRPVVVSLELCGSDGEVPASEREDPRGAALTQMAGLLMSLYADLFSVGKEGTYDQNILNSLIQHDGRSNAQAVSEATIVCERIMVLFLRLREEVLPTVSEPTRDYLANLGHAVRGVLEWSYNVPRFTPSDGDPPPRFDPVRISAPANPNATPLPYPSIAWWWDQLNGDDS